MPKKIIKRNGSVVPFRREKITEAVYAAAVAVGGRDRNPAEQVTTDVISRLESVEDDGYPTVEEVQDLVEKSLIERGHAKTAKAYIIYRYEHQLKREGRESLTYSSDNIPYRKLWQALSWGVDQGCCSLAELSEIIEEGRYETLVRASEDFYAHELGEACECILEKIGDIRLVIVSGPSSSGKTTTTLKISHTLQEKGYRFVTLNVDHYFFNLDDQPKDATGDYDYETPQALDLDLINDHLRKLAAGKKIQVPFYNFKTGNREGISGELQLKKNEILLIDSLHGMFDRMTQSLPDEKKFKLYIETLSQLKDDDGRFIRWADIRMLRRMVRDMQFRNYKPGQTAAHWHYVRRSELRYIISRIRKAHFIFNSFLPYELPIMKHRLGGLFPEIIEGFRNEPHGDRTDALERTERVMRIFSRIPEWEDESVVPPLSLLREFIGKSGYTY